MGYTGKTFGARGSANVVWATRDDRIVDLCQAAPATLTGGATSSIGSPPADPSALLAGLVGGLGSVGAGLASIPAGLFPAPTPDTSWLHYENIVRVVVDTGRLLVKTLPTSPITGPDMTSVWDATVPQLPIPQDATIPESQIGDGSAQNNSQQSGSQNAQPGDTVFQQRTTPTMYVIMEGRALRYGYTIPEPQLVTVNGVNAVRVNDTKDPNSGFATGVVGSSIYPVVGARWRFKYAVPGLTSIDPLPNPLV